VIPFAVLGAGEGVNLDAITQDRFGIAQDPPPAVMQPVSPSASNGAKMAASATLN